MIQQVRFSSDFQRSFKQLKKRYRSLPVDFNRLLLALAENPYQGDELYDGMRKVRIAFTSKGRGKRGGGRVIIRLTVEDTCLSFLYIYDKSDMQNVSDAFLDEIILELDQQLD
ncbi:MAG: type II toxin-antitoxin system RelE/ParE family toxin [Paludibacteraceae bacterium]|nr:type II toxin-antitoxin system RelE/ParE family toxin [Paludibacteraceae bacterium]